MLNAFEPDTTLTLWGVRGSFPTPRLENFGFGGNTPCISIMSAGDPPLIVDAGTGILALGEAWQDSHGDTVNLVFTHFHWDHLQGLPGFRPLYDSRVTIHMHSGVEPGCLQELLSRSMEPPYFPVRWGDLPCRFTFTQIAESGEQVGHARIYPIPLRHPNECFGYRIELPDGVVVVATDHELGDAALDENLRRCSHGADLLILDAQYTPEDYDRHRGWGHSCWTDAVKFARAADVDRLVLFHHDPARTDEQIDSIAAMAALEFPATTAAREGTVIRLQRKESAVCNPPA